MSPEALTPLVLFVLVSTISPGGATTLATASGANFGFRRSLPLIAGIAAWGSPPWRLRAAGGLAGLLLALPSLQWAMKTVGSAYLLWLAWQIARRGAPHTTPRRAQPGELRRRCLDALAQSQGLGHDGRRFRILRGAGEQPGASGASAGPRLRIIGDTVPCRSGASLAFCWRECCAPTRNGACAQCGIGRPARHVHFADQAVKATFYICEISSETAARRRRAACANEGPRDRAAAHRAPRGRSAGVRRRHARRMRWQHPEA